MHQQQLVRLQAGPESVLWTKKLLDAEPEKLTMMKEWLTRAEEVTLDGNDNNKMFFNPDKRYKVYNLYYFYISFKKN